MTYYTYDDSERRVWRHSTSAKNYVPIVAREMQPRPSKEQNPNIAEKCKWCISLQIIVVPKKKTENGILLSKKNYNCYAYKFKQH